MHYHTRRGVIGAAIAGLFAATGPAHAADYFEGKKITVTVPSGSGGTYHVYCQLVSFHLGRHIPGNPTVITQNRPGAGGALAAAYMMNRAEKDGTDIAMIAPGSITAPLVNKVTYDAKKFRWLGSVVARSSAIWVWHTKGVKSFEDLKRIPIKLGSTGFAAGGSVVPRLINKTLGTKLQLVYGYKSGGDINIAIERGEVDGRWNFRSGFASVRPAWLKENKIIAMIATGPRDVHHKNIPHLRDVLKAGSLEQKVYDLIALDYEVGQAFYAPPGTPDDVLKILQSAFGKMVKDPKFRDDIISRRIELEPLTAAQVERRIDEGFKLATPEVMKKFRAIHADTRKKKGKG